MLFVVKSRSYLFFHCNEDRNAECPLANNNIIHKHTTPHKNTRRVGRARWTKADFKCIYFANGTHKYMHARVRVLSTDDEDGGGGAAAAKGQTGKVPAFSTFSISHSVADRTAARESINKHYRPGRRCRWFR